MPDFSVILQDSAIRSVVQDRLLDRAFRDALFPRLLFRAAATPVKFPGNLGDSITQSAGGLLPTDLRPLAPGVDPTPDSYEFEQWVATVQQFARTMDTHMPTSAVALANLFYQNCQKQGLQAGQILNRVVRNRLYAAGLSGHTVTTAAVTASTAVPVIRLNGFTTARRPDLPAGSPVQFAPVSVTNPLPIIMNVGGTPTARNVVGFTPDNPSDQIGPGTLTIDVAITVASRSYVLADDRTSLVRVGGGLRVDDLTSGNVLTLSAIRSAVARFRRQNVPPLPDMRFHCHLDPTSEAQIFEDAEFQRLLTSMPDYYMYADFAIGTLMGTVFLRNNECPLPETVTNTSGAYNVMDPFPGELINPTSVTVHRPIFYGQGGIMEYYLPLEILLTEAGVQGKIGEPKITNNGIEVNVERVQIFIRGANNRLGDMVSSTWKFIGDWAVRTDVTTGDVARYKRFQVIEHGGSS